MPALREELRILPANPDPDGAPAWVIQDPVRNRFFRIGWSHFEMLLNWKRGRASAVVEQVNGQTTLNLSVQDVLQFSTFLADHELLRLERPADTARIHQTQLRRRQTGWQWLLHHYLFFRIPLLRPQHWLAQCAPYLNWLQTRTTALAVLGTTVLGLYLVSRQWEVFTHTLLDQMSFSGLMGYGVALVFAKTLHELGHAFRATHHGVRVAHMGVAFLVMFPMLYTDTGESWRLRDARHRRQIASAGIVVELALAGLATFAWAICPDGAWRNGLFFLATTSWVITLAINANPLMRFDGYFILSDFLDLPNLHERSSALARVWLRHVLLGWPKEWPEAFAPNVRRLLIGFALTAWVYRLVVFLGIALLVYFFFFKVLGIFLMVVELVWFIGMPVYRELKIWRDNVSLIRTSRRWLAGLALVVVLLALFLPWSTAVHGHGWLRAEQQQALFSPFEAQVSALPAQHSFRRGDVVMTLDSTLLGYEQARAQALANAREQQLLGLMGLPQGEQERAVLASEQRMYEAQANSSINQQARLSLRAPFDGVLKDLDPDIESGSWVKPQHPLAWIVNPARWVVDAYVTEVDLARLQPAQRVRVRQLVDPPLWLEGRVQEIDFTRASVLPSPMLDVRHGGPLVVIPSQDQHQPEPVLRDVLYRVRIELDQLPEQQRLSLVRVQIEGERESLAGQLLRSAVSVFIRESGA